MSYTKYVMDGDGRFVLMNKFSGLDHSMIALLLAEDAVSAGFLHCWDGELTAYGQSISLGMKSREEDTQIIRDAFDGGSVKIQFDEVSDSWFAANINHLHMLPDDVTVETLISKKIIEPR